MECFIRNPLPKDGPESSFCWFGCGLRGWLSCCGGSSVSTGGNDVAIAEEIVVNSNLLGMDLFPLFTTRKKIIGKKY